MYGWLNGGTAWLTACKVYNDYSTLYNMHGYISHNRNKKSKSHACTQVYGLRVYGACKSDKPCMHIANVAPAGISNVRYMHHCDANIYY